MGGVPGLLVAFSMIGLVFLMIGIVSYFVVGTIETASASDPYCNSDEGDRYLRPISEREFFDEEGNPIDYFQFIGMDANTSRPSDNSSGDPRYALNSNSKDPITEYSLGSLVEASYFGGSAAVVEIMQSDSVKSECAMSVRMRTPEDDFDDLQLCSDGEPLVPSRPRDTYSSEYPAMSFSSSSVSSLSANLERAPITSGDIERYLPKSYRNHLSEIEKKFAVIRNRVGDDKARDMLSVYAESVEKNTRCYVALKRSAARSESIENAIQEIRQAIAKVPEALDAIIAETYEADALRAQMEAQGLAAMVELNLLMNGGGEELAVSAR